MNPMQLHSSLAVLDSKKAILFGCSFGGRTAIRHAELYAGRSFPGYISYSGAVDFATGLKCCSPICLPIKRDLATTYGDELERAGEYLDPTPFLGDITERVLLIHPSDDNQVTIATSLRCYKQLTTKPKNRAQFFSITHGGFGEKNIPNHKGHHVPNDAKSIEEIGRVIVNFIDDVYEPPEASELRALRARVHAYKYLRNAKPEQKFLAAAFGQWLNASVSSLPNDQQWQADYAPLYKVFWSLEQLKQRTDFAPAIIDGIVNRLSSEAIARGIRAHAHHFAKFVIETKELQYDEKRMRDFMLENKALHAHFSNLIALPESDEDFKRIYALTALLESNPHLVDHVVMPEIDELVQGARLNFEKLLKREMSLVEKINSSTH